MKFDFQFINWFISLFTKKNVATQETKISVSPAESDRSVLLLLADSIGLRHAMLEMVDFWEKRYPGSKPRYWAIFDTTVHSKNKRLKVFDVVARKVSEYYCAHGKNSDPNFTGMCVKYSNEPGSLCTSEGIYRCSETYISGKFGYAMRLDGLESSNSNARSRAVVFHGAKYAEDAYVKQNGKTGRSEGCTAVGFQYSKDLVDKLKNGSPLFVYAAEGKSTQPEKPNPVQAVSGDRISLSWELTDAPHPERKAWSDEIISTLKKDIALYETATDIYEIFPKYNSMSFTQKLKGWGEYWVAKAYFESGYNPRSSSVDVGSVKDRNSYSDGLYQMSGNDGAAKHFGYDYKDLLEPIPNIRTAMEQMRRQLKNGKMIFLPNSSKYRYWAVALRGNKYSKIESILARIRKHTGV